MKVQTWFQVLFVFCIFQEMKDFDGQRGIVQKVLAASVRVTMLSGPAAGVSKTFPFQNVSKAMPKDKEGGGADRQRDLRNRVLKMSLPPKNQRMVMQIPLIEAIDPTTWTMHSGEPQIALCGIFASYCCFERGVVALTEVAN